MRIAIVRVNQVAHAYCPAERATSHNNCLYWWIMYITNECIAVFLVQFTHAVRFDHLVVCSGKDLVDLWAARYFVGLTPQVNMAKVQITVSVNLGFHAILLGIFKNANYFHVIANVTVDGSWIVIIFLLKLKGVWILCLYFPFYDFED